MIGTLNCFLDCVLRPYSVKKKYTILQVKSVSDADFLFGDLRKN